MNIITLFPPPDLDEYVTGILIIESKTFSADFILPLYANGCPTLVFQTALGKRSGSDTGYLNLYGQTIQPETLMIRQPFTLIAFFMRPHIVQSLFGVSARELTDNYLDLSDIKPINDTGLIDRLLAQPQINERLEILNGFIRWLAKQANGVNPRVLFALQYLKINTNANALSALQTELNISERSLQRLFENNVGISPKMYKRISQFDRAFKQLTDGKFNSLTELAYSNGFADQSHYIRVFKEFTGIPPKEYINISKPFNPKF